MTNKPIRNHDREHSVKLLYVFLQYTVKQFSLIENIIGLPTIAALKITLPVKL